MPKASAGLSRAITPTTTNESESDTESPASVAPARGVTVEIPAISGKRRKRPVFSIGVGAQRDKENRENKEEAEKKKKKRRRVS